jgi:hypothetical protein
VAVRDATTRRLVGTSAVTVTGTKNYFTQVRADAPWAYWRLGEAGGDAQDSSGAGRIGTYRPTITRNVVGPLSNDANRAITFDGVSGEVTTATLTRAPEAFSVEAWFRTSTTRGGALVGFGNAQTGVSASGSSDRVIYMTNTGQLVFGVNNAKAPDQFLARTVTSAGRYNNNAWHHVVATMGPEGMKLYVDGAPVASNGTYNARAYNGYWRIASSQLFLYPSRPTSNFFGGTLDEVAIHNVTLPADTVRAHYLAR